MQPEATSSTPETIANSSGTLLGRSIRWLRGTSFRAKVLIFSCGILVFLTLAGFLEHRGTVETNRVTQRQEVIHSLNRRLADLGRTLVGLRSLQLHMYEDPRDNRVIEVNAALAHLDKVAAQLESDLAAANLGVASQSLSRFLAVFQRYKHSTADILATQTRIGFDGTPGLMDRMRQAEAVVDRELREHRKAQLLIDFAQLRFDERQFADTLNLQFSDSMLVKLGALQVRLENSDLPSAPAKRLSSSLATYAEWATLLTRARVELELQAAAAKLAYTRAEVPLRESEKTLDHELSRIGQRYSIEAGNLVRLQLVTFAGSGLFVLLYLLVLLRGSVQLARRLKTLTARTQTMVPDTVALGRRGSLDDLDLLTASFDQMSERIDQQIASIEQARDQADRANEAKSRFIATVSHEVRTPMSGLLTTLQLMAQTKLDEEQVEYVDIMRLSGDRMLELVSDLLDFAKMEADKLELATEPFSLHGCAKEATALFQGSAAEKGLALSCTIESGVPNAVIGDAARLRQVILNLIGNAIKFTECGTIDVKIEQVARPDPQRALVQFRVRDSGIGIDPDMQRRLFAPFVQVDGTATRSHTGTGLGLTISARIVALWGGELRVESTVGVGTTFWFELEFPCRANHAEVDWPRQLPQLPANLAQEVPLNVLVVEDDALSRRTLSRLLEKLGYVPVMATDGAEALSIIEEHTVDLVFMDMQMPVLDGLRATREMRRHPRNRAITVIGLSGNASAADQEKCRRAGMDGFLSKPFEIDEFVETIRGCGRISESTALPYEGVSQAGTPTSEPANAPTSE